MTELVATGELSPGHHYFRLAEVNMATVPLQEQHYKDSLLLELTDNECLLDSLISDMSCQLDDTIKGNT